MERITNFILNWLNRLLDFTLTDILPALLLVVIGIVVIVIIKKIVNSILVKSKLEKAAHSLIKSVISVILYLLLGLIVASKLGIDVTGVVALASVLTLAISLSVQNMLTNLIGGFTLLSTKPFVSGDFVEIAGQSGTVKEIGLTYTKLLTPDNKEVSIPNSAVVAAQIVNTRSPAPAVWRSMCPLPTKPPWSRCWTLLPRRRSCPRCLRSPASPPR